MTTLVELVTKNNQKPFIVCDVSPPRGGSTQLLDVIADVTPDMFFVAANPGRSVRVSSSSVAQWIESNTKIPALFAMTTRDMNKTAMQTTLLGAHVMGLRNLVVVKGDNFTTTRGCADVSVKGFTPTEFIRSVKKLNKRTDFTGRVLSEPTDFCVGSTLDTSRDWGSEISLTAKKIRCGSDFLIAQPNFDPVVTKQFLEQYKGNQRSELKVPIMWGVQIMSRDSISFTDVPEQVTKELALGNAGYEIALDMIHKYQEIGIKHFYLVPPIFPGGRRDYESAQAVIEEL